MAGDAQDLLDDIKEMQSDSAGNFVLKSIGMFVILFSVVLHDLERYGKQSETMSLNVAASLREAGLLLDKISAVKMLKHKRVADHAFKYKKL